MPWPERLQRDCDSLCIIFFAEMKVEFQGLVIHCCAPTAITFLNLVKEENLSFGQKHRVTAVLHAIIELLVFKISPYQRISLHLDLSLPFI